MPHYFRLPSLVALSVIFLSQSAFAQMTSKTGEPPEQTGTISGTVTAWGLIGTWAADCSAKTDEDHVRSTYRVDASGHVIHERNFGNFSDHNEIVGAAISEIGVLGVQEIYSGSRREYGFLKQANGSIKAMYNRNEKNEYTIKEGLIVSSGKPANVQNRCE